MNIILIAWSAAAFVWWLMALYLLGRGGRRQPLRVASGRPTITVFKPLPPVRTPAEHGVMAEAMASFISQFNPDDELLVGMNAADAPAWQPTFEAWRATWPSARIHIIARDVPRQCANPKIAWLQVLAPSAQGKIWVWSDTDVTIPPGFLDELCGQLEVDGNHAVTAAYAIRRITHAHEMLDTLFVNLEFLPGALLLGRLKHQDFAYGAAIAFRAETFHAKVDWETLGASLADDHKLGELLQPVTLSPAIVATVPNLSGWREAWQHYYRWHKTVRWCRPTGYAALLLLMPVFGWGLAGCVFGFSQWILSGLAMLWFGEIAVAVLACVLVGCPLPPATWPGLLLWPVFRASTWLLVWLPLPVFWSGRKRAWHAPLQK